jgi:hypothetical protein
VSNLSIAAGFVVTTAVVGGKTGGAAPELIECFDNRPAVGLLSPCYLIAP